MGFSNYNNPSAIPQLNSVSLQRDPYEDVKNMLVNLNEEHRSDPPLLFRENLIRQSLSILIGSKKPNVLLVGSAGCGKTAIAEEIGRRLDLHDPSIPFVLDGYTVYELPISSIVANSMFSGQLEARLQNVIEFASLAENKVILFIDEIHLLCGNNSTYTTIAQVLKPALARGKMKVIAATTQQESKNLLRDPAFNRRFSRLHVDELTPDQTVSVLKTIAPSLQNHYYNRISVSDDLLKDIVAVADQYSAKDSHRPDTAITLMDRIMADTALSLSEKENMILHQDQQTGQNLHQCFLSSLPVQISHDALVLCARRLMTGNAETPEFDEGSLREAFGVLKGQGDVVEYLIQRIRRYACGLFPDEKPLSLLLAGSSGTGKSESARIIARVLSANEPISLNMTEFTEPSTINRLIGSPSGYIGSDSNAEKPFDPLLNNPYQVILIDEFEKACPAVQKLFMQILDEGVLCTNQNEMIDFSHAIMFFTTNAGGDRMLNQKKSFGFQPPVDMNRNQDQIDVLSSVFDTALLNRFEKVLFYQPISKDDYRIILSSVYQKQRMIAVSSMPRLKLPEDLSEDALNELCEKSYDTRFGARPALKTIRDYLEVFAYEQI